MDITVKIVVDTSAIIAVIANEPNKPKIIEATRGADLLAPASVHWEIANAFSAMLKRQRITLEDALKAITVYQQIPIRLVEVELAETLSIASQFLPGGNTRQGMGCCSGRRKRGFY
jgi:predicted nucleic acid-binding protein